MQIFDENAPEKIDKGVENTKTNPPYPSLYPL